MAKLKVVIELNFEEYFNKWGFGDGDGPEQHWAFDHRQAAIDCLNEEFEKRGLKSRAEEFDPGSIHNCCRILIKGDGVGVTSRGGDLELYADGDHTEVSKAKKAGLTAALEAAKEKWEERINEIASEDARGDDSVGQ